MREYFLDLSEIQLQENGKLAEHELNMYNMNLKQTA
jgi:hypothetical protein